MIKPYPKFLLLLLINLLAATGYSQSRYEYMLDIQRLIEKDQYEIAQAQFKKIDEASLSKTSDKALYTYIKADLLGSRDNYTEAYKHYLKAKKMYLAIDSTDRAMDINLNLFNLITSRENYGNTYKKYFDEYIDYAYKKGDSTRIARSFIIKGEINIDNNPRESLKDIRQAISILNKIHNTKLASHLNAYLAVIYNEKLHKPDSALYYLRNELDGIKQSGTINDIENNYINQAAAYYYMHDHKKAIEYLKLADNLPYSGYRGITKQDLSEFFYMNYDAIGDYPNAYKFLKLNKKLSDSLSVNEQRIEINKIETKYRTKEKELENTLLKSKVKTSQILIYGIILVLLAIVAIAFLMIKNSRRREKISKQEKLIEQQQYEKTLKEYELNSIDMMLEGQEKERQRLANDLHDNLGSMLATLKFNFENLKLRKIELREEENKLYERTDELIEEAYQKVRGIAHAKNAGVLASEGLIPAIQKLAEKISIPSKLQIQVIAFGFNDRLENTLEIAIFRTVQEMATNIIKHSQATEATIHLTDHEDNINIIIEDNGVGFDSSKLGDADGMGLQNIKKKIAQLGGTLEIDSTPGRGTTIIIDIPVKND